jgi:hypothetical protein
MYVHMYSSIAMISLKKYFTLAGTEPGSAAPQAGAMSSAPRRQVVHTKYFLKD